MIMYWLRAFKESDRKELSYMEYNVRYMYDIERGLDNDSYHKSEVEMHKSHFQDH